MNLNRFCIAALLALGSSTSLWAVGFISFSGRGPLITNSFTPIISETASDTDPLATTLQVLVQANGINGNTNGGAPGAVTEHLNLAGNAFAADGAYGVTVNASDDDGSAVVDYWTITVDTTAPSNSANAPNGTTNTGQPNLYVSLTDTTSGIDYSTIVMKIDGGAVSPVSAAASVGSAVDVSYTPSVALAAGPHSVSLDVQDLAGNAMPTFSWNFSVASAPTVTGLSFNSAAISGTAGLVITGTGFAAPLTVTINAIATSFIIDSATQITADAPAHVSGTGDVIVTSALGASNSNASSAFTYVYGPIVVNSTADAAPADDGVCTLREAIAAANTHTASGIKPGECGANASGADIISLPAGIITLANAQAALAPTVAMTISGSGSGSTFIDGGGVPRDKAIFSLSPGITLQGLTLQNASVGSNGGAVATNAASGTIALDDVVLYKNTAGEGGGIFLSGGLTGNFDQVRFISNTASLGAGAILVASGASLSVSGGDFEWNKSSNAGADGGAIYSQGGAGSLTLTQCYFADNSSPNNGGVIFCGTNGAVSITNSTFYLNSAGQNGGAIFFNISASTPAAVLDQLTFDQNTVTSGSGAAMFNNGSGAKPIVSRSIIFGNGAAVGNNLGNSALHPFASGDFNILPVAQSGLGADAHDSLTDPSLVAPADNGGFAFTQAIDQNSSAFNRVSTPSLLVDQRGTVRPQNGASDSGAFELASAPADGIAPTTSNAAPVDSSYFASGTVPVSITVSDNYHVIAPGSVTLTVNGVAQSYSSFVNGDGSLSVTYTGGTFTDGFKQVTLTAKDPAGNQVTTAWVFTVDTLSPTASADNAPNSFTNISTVAQVFITDANLSYGDLTLTVNGSNSFLLTPTATGGSLTAGTLPIEGWNGITLTAKDLAGNVGTVLLGYTLDTTAPVLNNALPANLAYVNTGTPVISADFNDVDMLSVTLTVDAAVKATTFNTASGTISFTPGSALAQGVHSAVVTAVDKAGNTSTLSWSFTVDTIFPTAALQAPLDLTWTANNAPLIWANTADLNFQNATITVEGANEPFAYNGVSLTITPSVVFGSDGLKHVTLTATDKAGNQTTLPWVFHVDTTAPVASNGAPVGVTNLAAQVVTVHVSDGPGIGVITGGLVVKLDGAVTPFGFDGTTVTLTASTFSDGTHYVEVLPTDQLGNVGADYNNQFTVITDPIAPVASNPSPVGVTTNASPLIFAQLSDVGSGVAPASVSMTVDGVAVSALAGASNVSLSASSLLPGVHTVTVDLKDVAGNKSTQLVWQFTVTTDTIAPTVSNPTPLGIVNTPVPFIHVSLSDLGGSGVAPASVSMTVDGVAVPALANATDVSYTATGLVDGIHTVTVDVAIHAGNKATQFFWTFQVQTDTIAPVASHPSPVGVTTNASPLIFAQLSDVGIGVAPASVSMTVDGLAVPALASANNVSLSASSLLPGVHTVTVDLKDFAGNRATQLVWQFTVVNADSTPPVIAFNAPVGLTNTPNPNIYASVSDTGVGVDTASIIVKVDGSAVAPTILAAAAGTGIDVSFSASNLSLGTHHVSVDAKDALGNQAAQLNWNFTVVNADTTPPVFSLASPTGTNYGSAISIYASLTDTGAGVDLSSVLITLDGNAMPTSAVIVGNSVSVTASGVEPLGVHHVSIDAKDLLGNAAAQYNWSFTSANADNTAPVISANAPVGLTDTPSPDIYASVTDTGVGVDTSSIIMKVDGSAVAPTILAAAAGTGVDISFTASGLSLGAHHVSVDVKDSLGNVATQLNWVFTVVNADTTPPLISFNAPVGSTNTASPNIYASVTDTGVGVDSSTIVMRVDGTIVTPVLGAATATGIDISFTASALSLGTHHVSVDAKDSLGNTAAQLNWVLTVTDPDVTAPVVSAVTAPTTAVRVTVTAGAVIPVSYSYTEDNPASVSITVSQGGTVIGMRVISSGLAPNASRTDNVSLLSSAATGVYDVLVTVYDKVGQVGSLTSNASVLVDAAAPVISNASPLGITTNANTIITALFTEADSGINPATAVMHLDGAVVASATDGTSITFTASALADGLHHVTVDVKDNAGNSATQLSWQFTVQQDVTAPVVSAVTAPTSSARLTVTAGAVIPVSYSYTEDNPASVSITVSQGGTVIGSKVISSGLAPNASRTDNVSLLSSAATGVFDVLVTVYDKVGQVGSLTSNASVLLDTTAPVISNASPLGITTNANTIITALFTEADSGINPATAVMHLDGAVVASATDGTSITFTASALADGLHHVTVDVKDNAGNSATQLSWQFTVQQDVTAPVVSAVTAPTSSARLTVTAGAVIPVSYTYTELNPASVSITVSSGGTVIGTKVISSGLAPNDSRTDEVSLQTGVADGVYDVLVTVYDKVGQVGSLTSNASVLLDTTAPVISAGLPLGITTNANTIMTALFTESGSGINPATAVMHLDGAVVASATDGTSITFTASALADGLHHVTVDVKDNAGNSATQLSWQFTVQQDVTAPVVSAVTAPTSSARLTVTAGAVIPVSYTYTELNPASVSITVSSGGTVIGTKVISSGLAPNDSRTDEVSLQTGVADGVYDVLVTVYDKVGQVGSLTSNASVLLDTTAPVISAGLPLGITTNANTIITALFTESGSGINPATAVMHLDGAVVASATDGTSITFTASALADGLHHVTVDVKDNAGNSATQLSWQFTVQQDVTAPVVSAVTAPSTAVPVTVAAGSTIPVSYTYTELNPASVSITVSSGGTVIGSKFISSGLAPNDSRTDSVSLLSGAPTGVYSVLVTVFDKVGQSGSLTSNASVIVDANLPTASTEIPLSNSTVIDVNGNTTISLQLADTGGSVVSPGSVKLTLDGNLQPAAMATASGTGVSVTYTATGLSAGLHTVSVAYADAVGNTGLTKTWSFTMVRDNIAPIVSVITPQSASPWYSHASGTVDVRYFYSEANPAWISITVQSAGTVIGQQSFSSGLAAGDVTLTSSVTLLGGAATGAYDVSVTVVDLAGNQGSNTSASSVVVDNSVPTISAASPAGGSISQTAAPILSATLADTGGSGISVGTAVMRLDGVIVAATAGATMITYNSSGLADGPHTVDVDVSDRSGNPAQRLSWSFRTDISVPSVALENPLAGAFVRGTVPLDALSSDAGSGVTRTAFFYGGSTLIGTSFFNGTAWNDGTGVSPSASTRWDTTALADGVYVLKAQAVDLVGNTGTSSSVMVTVDNTLPIITINTVLSPTQYQAQTITGQLTEQNFSQLKVNGILATVAGSAPNFTWTAVVPLISGANGITVTAGDLAGNSASVVVGITYDPTAPVAFLAPLVPGAYRGTVAIQGNAPDNTRWLTFEVSPDNGTTWFSVGTGLSVAGSANTLTKTALNGWQLSWDTVADGLADSSAYKLRDTAYDENKVNLGSSVIGPFTVDNIAPTVAFTAAPLPVTVTVAGVPQRQVYTDLITMAGSLVEAGSGVVRVRLDHYDNSGVPVSDSPADLPITGNANFSKDVRLVSGKNTITFTAFDAAGNSSSSTDVIYYVTPQNSGTICSPGGSLAAPDGTSIVVPASALIACASLSIKTVLASDLASPADQNLKIVGVGHQIDPVSQVFQAQSTLTLPYTDADLDPDGDGVPNYQASALLVLFWDGSVWENVGVDNIDTVNKRVTVRTNHLGLFALAANTAALPTTAKVYLTHNPFRYGTDNTAFVYAMPSSGRVTIRIYDLAGDELRTLVKDVQQSAGTFTQVWDGLNNFNRFVGSGVYLYRFEARLDNGQTTTTTKAIGVLK